MVAATPFLRALATAANLAPPGAGEQRLLVDMVVLRCELENVNVFSVLADSGPPPSAWKVQPERPS